MDGWMDGGREEGRIVHRWNIKISCTGEEESTCTAVNGASTSVPNKGGPGRPETPRDAQRTHETPENLNTNFKGLDLMSRNNHQRSLWVIFNLKKITIFFLLLFTILVHTTRGQHFVFGSLAAVQIQSTPNELPEAPCSTAGCPLEAEHLRPSLFHSAFLLSIPPEFSLIFTHSASLSLPAYHPAFQL